MTYEYEQDPNEGMGVVVWCLFAVVFWILFCIITKNG